MIAIIPAASTVLILVALFALGIVIYRVSVRSDKSERWFKGFVPPKAPTEEVVANYDKAHQGVTDRAKQLEDEEHKLKQESEQLQNILEPQTDEVQ